MGEHEERNPMWKPGDIGITRRGKRGTIKEVLPNGEVLVAFSPGHAGFVMRESALVTVSAYERMNAPRQKQMYQ